MWLKSADVSVLVRFDCSSQNQKIMNIKDHCMYVIIMSSLNMSNNNMWLPFSLAMCAWDY